MTVGGRSRGTALGQAMIYVRDAQRSKRFYMEVLGLSLNYDHNHFVSLEASNGAWIGLHSTDAADQVSSPGIQLGFKVEDVDREYERIRGMGVEVQGPPVDEPWRWRHLYLRDPDGYLISLYTMKVEEPHDPHGPGGGEA
jgi:catechol 2,3-dioxygenase-like lactoylglutathione lyase family enzyme